MRSAPAAIAASKTLREPSMFRDWVRSLAVSTANARCTTTSAPFSVSRTLAVTVGHHRVVTRAAADLVAAAVAGEHEVVARSRGHLVAAAARRHAVVARAGGDAIVARPAVDHRVAPAHRHDHVVAGAAAQRRV